MLNIPAKSGAATTSVPASITALFGDGRDGTLTLTSGVVQSLPEWISSSDYITYDLLRDANPTTLTVGSGCTLRVHGWLVLASTAIVNAGTIHADGEAAVGATGGTGAPWPYMLSQFIGIASPPAFETGGNGRTNNTTGASTAWLGGGGYGGGGGGVGAGADGTVTSSIEYRAMYRSPGYPGESRFTPMDIAAGAIDPQSPTGEGGGGGGSADGDGGGGGGMGGQIMELCAPTITNSGTIRAAGGAGGDATGANGGGGGGGGGGLIFLTYTLAYTNTGTVTVPGGAGGAGTGTGRDGVVGGDGAVIILAL